MRNSAIRVFNAR